MEHKQSIIPAAIRFAEEVFESDHSGHDFFHTMRVYKTARRIAQEEGANVLTVQLAALLHDVDDAKLSPQTTAHKDRAVRFLETHGVASTEIETICKIIGEVSFSANGDAAPSTLEGKCVQDADRLDALGAIGIARTFAYGGSHGRAMFDPTGQNAASSVNHFYEKLFRLKALMNTASAKKEAERRDQYMRAFIAEFMAEWDDQPVSTPEASASPGEPPRP